jgi:putative radical SAM enzyme (TIGR03279 family)
MAIIISGAEPGSAAEKLNIPPGFRLISINGREVNDLLDYGFYSSDGLLRLEIAPPDGAAAEYTVEKCEGEELGFRSGSFLMDRQKGCRNRCVFCFIDQMPPGMRESLYFKDDDERLSFLFGNYITLTNLGEAEIERIIEMKISPVNISVHTTNPELRRRMMGSGEAGAALKRLYRLAEAGVEINCQIVLCRGLNDGAELEATLRRLCGLWPSVRSVACVPAGLTAHRRGLPELVSYDGNSAAGALDIIDGFNAACRSRLGAGVVYPADELLLLAGRDIPPLDYYDELLQLENGVGMTALFEEEFSGELARLGPQKAGRRSTAVTGELAAPFIARMARRAEDFAPGLSCEVVAVKNEFFGGNVSVSGLVTARDITNQLKGRDIGPEIMIPENMLRREGDMFLDGVTVGQLSETLGCGIKVIGGGADLARALIGGRRGLKLNRRLF